MPHATSGAEKVVWNGMEWSSEGGRRVLEFFEMRLHILRTNKQKVILCLISWFSMKMLDFSSVYLNERELDIVTKLKTKEY